MDSQIVADMTPLTQSPSPASSVGADLVDAWYVDEIAVLLARRRQRNPALVLGDLPADELRLLRSRATMALRGDDPAYDLPARYLAADAMIAVTGAGPLLGSLPRQRRMDKVRLATAGIRTYRRALAGELPGQVRQIGLLAVADAEANTKAEAQS